MRKYLACGATALLGLGLAAKAHQTPAASEPAKEKTDAVTVAVATEAATTEAAADPADKLQEVYSLLTRFRYQRLDDRPKALASEATQIYRKAIEAYDAEDMAKARSYTDAATAVVKALDLSLRGTEEKDDQALPRPPMPRALLKLRAAPRVVTTLPAKPGEALPPLLVEGQAISFANAEAHKIAGQVDQAIQARVINVPVVTGNVVASENVTAKVVGDDEKATIFVTGVPAGDTKIVEKKVVVDQPKGATATLFPAFSARQQALEALHKDLGTQQQKLAQLQKQYAYTIVKANGGEPDARATLKRAYEKVKAARAKDKDGKAKLYLDAARDLYNAARREAEAGRWERSGELARAAEALTLVPQHLGAVQSKTELRIQTTKPVEGTKYQGNTSFKLFVNPEKVEGQKSDAESKKIERFEYRVVPRTDGPKIEEDKKPGEGDKAEAGETKIGVGLALSEEEGKVLVSDILPDSPASKDGRIKPGDQLLGVKGDDGEDISFEGKGLADAVKLIGGGKPGSKVVLVVKPKDSDEKKNVELTRATLKLSKITPDGDDAAKAAKAAYESAIRLSGEQAQEILKSAVDAKAIEDSVRSSLKEQLEKAKVIQEEHLKKAKADHEAAQKMLMERLEQAKKTSLMELRERAKQASEEDIKKAKVEIERLKKESSSRDLPPLIEDGKETKTEPSEPKKDAALPPPL